MMDVERGGAEVRVMIRVLVKPGSGRISEGKPVRGDGNDVGAETCVVQVVEGLEECAGTTDDSGLLNCWRVLVNIELDFAVECGTGTAVKVAMVWYSDAGAMEEVGTLTEYVLESVFPGFVTVRISTDEVTAGLLDNSAEEV